MIFERSGDRRLRAALLVWVVVGAGAGCTRPLQGAPCPCLTSEWICCAGSCVPAGSSCAAPVDGAGRIDGMDSGGDGAASDYPPDLSGADQPARTIDGGSDLGLDGEPAPDGPAEAVDAPSSRTDGAAGNGSGGVHGKGG